MVASLVLQAALIHCALYKIKLRVMNRNHWPKIGQWHFETGDLVVQKATFNPLTRGSLVGRSGKVAFGHQTGHSGHPNTGTQLSDLVLFRTLPSATLMKMKVQGISFPLCLPPAIDDL